MGNNEIIKGVANYYSRKINDHGKSHGGVDWNSKESQYLRFEILSKVIQPSSNFSILDYGCGYGEYINFLKRRFDDFNYSGFDVSIEMINAAKDSFNEFSFYSIKQNIIEHDYTIASGIFNVKNEVSNDDWESYILSEIDFINSISKRGFAFNALTMYSDKEYMRNYLYYADPLKLFDYCKSNFSQKVALLHDYELYEFTIIVKK